MIHLLITISICFFGFIGLVGLCLALADIISQIKNNSNRV